MAESFIELAQLAARLPEGDLLMPPHRQRERISLPLVGLLSSRLGTCPRRRGEICRRLARSVLDCRRRGGTLLVGQGTAIEDFARRAAEVFRVPLLLIGSDRDGVRADRKIGEPVCDLELRITAQAGEEFFSNDDRVAWVADRLDVLYARAKGRVVSATVRRLDRCRDGSTRVAVPEDGSPTTTGLIAAGAIGWYWLPEKICGSPSELSVKGDFDDPELWTSDWLVHCTRGRADRWPDETLRQYQDALLLGGQSAAKRRALDALQRIVQSRRLIGSAITSAKSTPVVCFSSIPLRDLLHARSYRPHLKRWDYEPYGIAIRRRAASTMGARPVIYGTKDLREKLPSADRYLFQASGNTYDWTSEREWRVCGSVDLAKLPVEDVRVFVPQRDAAARIASVSPWQVVCVSDCPNRTICPNRPDRLFQAY